MKKLLLLFAFIALISVLHAQNAYVAPGVQSTFHLKKFKATTDTAAIRKMLYQSARKQNYAGNMPVVALNSVQLTYQGNNGNGLDLYLANIDNMPVVMPDASFYSAMPATGNKYPSVTISPAPGGKK